MVAPSRFDASETRERPDFTRQTRFYVSDPILRVRPVSVSDPISRVRPDFTCPTRFSVSDPILRVRPDFTCPTRFYVSDPTFRIRPDFPYLRYQKHANFKIPVRADGTLKENEGHSPCFKGASGL